MSSVYGKHNQTPWDRTSSSRNADNIEDKFWAALNFAIEDTLPCTAFDPKASRARTSTNASPIRLSSDSTQICLPARSERGNTSNLRAAEQSQSLRQRNKNTIPLQVKVPSIKSSVSVKSTPTTAIPRSALSPFASRSPWHIPTHGEVKPSTPVHNLVTSFLDSISPDSKSRSSTPMANIAFDPNQDNIIVESEVLIQVVEDISQPGSDSPVDEYDLDCYRSLIELGVEEDFRKLQIPPSPITVPAKAGFDIPSAFVANGPAGCAQELDALWRMRWDRLFARDAYY